MKSSVHALCLSLQLGLAPAALVLTSCSADTEERSATGTLEMPLTTTGASGAVYRLRDGTFAISGTESATGSTETDPDATELEFELKEGNYLIKLKNGWRMERKTDGDFAPVEAILLSENPQGFGITDQDTTNVAFQFRAGDDVLELGNGKLVVTIDVEEVGEPAGPPDLIDVDTLTPIVTDLFANGGGIAAQDGFTFVEDFPGHEGMDGRIFRVEPDGTVDENFFTGVAAGFKPLISQNGTLLNTGNDRLMSPPYDIYQHVDEYDPNTGDFLNSLYFEAFSSSFNTTSAQLPNGDIIFGTQDTDGGIRQVTSPFSSEKIADGFGNNVFLTATSDGTIVIGTGWVFGKLNGPDFEQIFDTGGQWSTTVVAMPDDSILLSTNPDWGYCSGSGCQGKVYYFPPDLSAPSEYLTTAGDFGVGGFNSIAYDATTQEVVVLTSNGKLYRIAW